MTETASTEKKIDPAENPIPVPRSTPSGETPAANQPPEQAAKPKEEPSSSESKNRRNDRDDDDDPGSGREHRALHPEVKPHCFVVMPFGKKTNANGDPYDFNAIYKTVIKPAIEEAGFEASRADEATESGDILTDMFQELLLADMVVCDMSIDNANAYYELGIRHALRKRGVVHVQAGRAYMPFDVFNVRTLPYHITREGVPDPEHIKNDIKAMARLLRDTWASDRDAVHSPIYNLLSGMREPDRKSLKTPLATGFWREYDEWKDRVTVAQRDKHIGDILLLTQEIKNPLIREEAIAEVGGALAKLGRNELALNQYREGISVNPGNLEFRREEAFHLNRVGRVNEAIVKLEGILNDYPKDTVSISYLGRIYKEMWTNSWNRISNKTKRIKTAFDTYHWLIKSIDIYLKGYRIDLRDNYPGINAYTLSVIAIHLADKFDSKKNPDPDIARIRKIMPGLRDTLEFSLESTITLEQDGGDYWSLVSIADLRLLTSNDPSEVIRSYRKAITALRRDLFSLRSSLNQLLTIKLLGIRPEFVSKCIDLIEEEIKQASTGDTGNMPDADRPGSKATGGRALIFAGYMVDFTGKDKKVFPPDKEGEVRQEIRKRVEKFDPGPQDRAFLAGLSAGSEIIFAEVCAEAGIKVKVFLPHNESAYIRKFVSPAGEAWVDRFYKIKNHHLVDEIYQSEHLGDPGEGENRYERNTRWALYSALGRVGIENMRLIVVANEFTFDTKDRDVLMTRYAIDLMRSLGGMVEEFINPSKYIYSVIDTALERMIQQESSKKKVLDNVQLMKKGQVKKKGS